MWANTGEGGEIEDPKLIPPLEKILKWCKTIDQTPDVPEIVEIEFVDGAPIALNGVKKKLSEIVMECNVIGGKHGVGVFNQLKIGWLV